MARQSDNISVLCVPDFHLVLSGPSLGQLVSQREASEVQAVRMRHDADEMAAEYSGNEDVTVGGLVGHSSIGPA